MTCQPAKWECWADGSTAELLNWSAMCYQSWNIKKRYLAAFQVKPNPLPQAKIIYMSTRSSDGHSVAILQLAFVNIGSLQWLYFTDFDGICNSVLPSFLSSSRFSCDYACACVCVRACVCVCVERQSERRNMETVYIIISPTSKGIILEEVKKAFQYIIIVKKNLLI